MSAYAILCDQCQHRGWKPRLAGTTPNGINNPGLVLDTLRIVDRIGDPLVAVKFGTGSFPVALNKASVLAAKVLAQKGLV